MSLLYLECNISKIKSKYNYVLGSFYQYYKRFAKENKKILAKQKHLKNLTIRQIYIGKHIGVFYILQVAFR